MGNRFVKIIKHRVNGVTGSQVNWEYWYYLRDAQGNIMATYKSTYENMTATTPYVTLRTDAY